MKQLLTLPEWQEDDGLDRQELHLGIISTKQLFGSNIEEEESIESESDANVVDNRYVQVAVIGPTHMHNTSLQFMVQVKIEFI